jgi:UPF0755 protein
MRTLFAIFIFLLLAGIAFAYWVFAAANIDEKKIGVKIPGGADYEQVLHILHENNVLKSEFTFNIVSNMKRYPGSVKSGYYVFNHNMNNRQIVNILQLGLQTPVTLVIYNIRTKEEFAGLIGRTLEIDSAFFLSRLNDENFCHGYKLDTANILTHFMVDNYELYWNCSMDRFTEKMDSAYHNFWNDERKAKARALELNAEQVTTLASIVQKEVRWDKELPTVAAVYLNRLKTGMPLQADPTLIFALHDFDARRVNSRHKEYDSPYNTYMHKGLPPGPVCMPYKKAIDAVLNSEKCDYLYFCANPDMSGYSIFSKTYQEQIKTAAQYHKKLNELNVH